MKSDIRSADSSDVSQVLGAPLYDDKGQSHCGNEVENIPTNFKIKVTFNYNDMAVPLLTLMAFIREKALLNVRKDNKVVGKNNRRKILQGRQK